MKRIIESSRVFDAWSEEKWTIDGAAVDVSLVCFGESTQPSTLNGKTVDAVNADLTSGLDLTQTATLSENADAAYLGIQKSGPFDIEGSLARGISDTVRLIGRVRLR